MEYKQSEMNVILIKKYDIDNKHRLYYHFTKSYYIIVLQNKNSSPALSLVLAIYLHASDVVFAVSLLHSLLLPFLHM